MRHVAGQHGLLLLEVHSLTVADTATYGGSEFPAPVPSSDVWRGRVRFVSWNIQYYSVLLVALLIVPV